MLLHAVVQPCWLLSSRIITPLSLSFVSFIRILSCDYSFVGLVLRPHPRFPLPQPQRSSSNVMTPRSSRSPSLRQCQVRYRVFNAYTLLSYNVAVQEVVAGSASRVAVVQVWVLCDTAEQHCLENFDFQYPDFQIELSGLSVVNFNKLHQVLHMHHSWS